MMRLFWVDGRFGWPVVIALTFVTLSALILDFVWRVLTISFERLVIYAAVIDVSAAAVMIAGYVLVNRRRI